jgi:hypothetical protein
MCPAVPTITDRIFNTFRLGRVAQGHRLSGLRAEGRAEPADEKKPKGREPSPAERRHNRALARVRIRVERAIGGIKRARCVKDILRNTRAECSDSFMEAATGLHNLRGCYRKRAFAPMSVKPYFL